MSFLLFKKPLFNLILNGEKTSTLRLKAFCKKGQVVTLCSGPRNIKVHITDVKALKMKDINNEVVKKEGFKNKKELKNTLNNIYPEKNIDNLTYIEFKVL